MGAHKKVHIRAISKIPRVAQAWQDVKGQPCTEDDIEAMFSMNGISREELRFVPDEHGGAVAGNLTVIDRDRMAVSLIYSVFHSFGAGLASDRFGILFQNRGAGFTLEEGHPNEAAGGKRPMHTIIPGMLRQDGKLHMTFGVMGGQYQSCGHGRFLTNVTDYGMDPQAAIDGPRLFPEPGGPLTIESGYSDAVKQELADKGHTLAPVPVGIGGAQAIRIDHDGGILEGGSDPRKDGCALGY